ncbi:Uncharacterised protein [Oligella ureolytica]|uniref:Lipoprotein n=1 Tax=Oligella ureolytica TaxID=90244 RepID=A0A378XI06_9BURK|nr:hypothetical protein [Oligella ureolytica]NLP31720.1 hypothetical protein [Oligella ureolytica]QPT39854.1 hypothetical protein I6G29_12180 [Oligella ureolytica]SUA52041.1 Uncharacterised protein [Oligella ureolytica]SUA57787.1 Uncharacterised protein [Oligella ureolytica]
MKLKKLLLLTVPVILSACASKIDVSSHNSYGLKCSDSASTSPDWAVCQSNADRVCAPLKATDIRQHTPTGSGSADDSYFISFSCQ